MTERTPLVAGNWKMNGTRAALGEIATLQKELQTLDGRENVEVMICPPATLLMAMSARVEGVGGILIGGQDCHPRANGAHTGDISAEMLKDAGAVAIIVGHSERRQDHHEDDETVRLKAEAAHRAGLIAIICIGETGAEREEGKTLDVLARQIAGCVPQTANGENTVIAYEPVWAIGTGKTPTPDDVAEIHARIRAMLTECRIASADAIRILYGGSVNPANAAELMALDTVDGALVGGASLRAEDFMAIIRACHG